MSRINEALQRAEQNGSGADQNDPASTPASTAGAAFSPGEDSVGNGDPETEHVTEANAAETTPETLVEAASPRPGRLMPRVAPLPMQLRSGDTADEIEIRDVLRMLASRWRLIVTVMVVSAATAITYNTLAIPIYQARARLVIDPDSNQVVPFRAVAEDTTRNDYFGTQLDVLRSRELMRQTLERMHILNKTPDVQAAQVGELLASLVVTPVSSAMGSRTVDVS